jgi:hypothetical protein
MNRGLFAVAVATVVLAVSATIAADGSATSGTVTIGQFATRLVAALGRDAASPETIRESLRSLGHPTVFDESATLTAGVVYRMASDLGVNILLPQNPDATVSDARAHAIAVYLAAVVVERGPAPTTEDPTRCLCLANRGECLNCCKEVTGLTGKPCSRFCQLSPPPSSPCSPDPYSCGKPQ